MSFFRTLPLSVHSVPLILSFERERSSSFVSGTTSGILGLQDFGWFSINCSRGSVGNGIVKRIELTDLLNLLQQSVWS